MIRVVIGSAIAAAAMFILGFIFFAVLGSIPVGSVGDPEAAAIQNVLAENMDNDGAYTALVPSGAGEAQQQMYLNGPIAMVHYNPQGQEIGGASTMLWGYIHMFVTALIIGAALFTLSGAVKDFAARLAILVMFGLAASFFMHLGNPIWWHQGWLYHGYIFVTDAIMFIAGGAIIARWFLPKNKTAEAAPATES